MRTGNLFVLSGPSGAGKGTLIGLLLKRLEGAWLSVSATTRAPREGEVDGVSYLFVSDDRFDEMVAQDRLLEWAQVHDHRYGTPRDLVERHIAAGDQVFLEIDVQGALQVRSKFPAAHLVFLLLGRSSSGGCVAAAPIRRNRYAFAWRTPKARSGSRKSTTNAS